MERDGAGLSYRIGKRWSWALIQNWKEMELSYRTGKRLENWREVELG